MQRRFPSPERKDKMSNYSTNNRFSSQNSNPFKSFNRSRRVRDDPPLPINTRAEALKGDDDTDEGQRYKNPFQRQNQRFQGERNSRFDNSETDHSFRRNDRGRNDRGRNDRGRQRFRRDDNPSRFRRASPPKKKEFVLKKDEFPALGGNKNKKITKTTSPLAFKEAAKRGEKCPTPPPRAPLPPPERLNRPKKYESDDGSMGWNTDDEKAAKEADPSDNEDEEDEPFWGDNHGN